ncbi:Erythromycin esterase homolog [Saccharopolyspora antimicrobica]|uniref:Erythromycin esterase homolog n=1 Tax=Saccharopolyspora antimicrobica TaxID=455193 RepID=A0A1I4XPX8_9PSEU|nr:erythromycin esterase family protein [Saccharopolyspora antimicrobica]RKT84599.1 erythromycin esterase-like protein [Saccharopolyspora antimicrobica]SFN27904.1 Erythromycin esterase homolog [Saccharopolyspora antimicrobica]
MSIAEIGRQLDDLGGAVDDLLAARPEPPVLLGLGEPTHGIEAFPLLRNELLPELVARGYRSIALETDHFAASVVDDYVAGRAADVDEVLETGFSHRFGAAPGNRELVEWLRAHNAERDPRDRVRFYGFDGPMEMSGAPSPRRALTAVIDYLPALEFPDVDALLGDDADWENQAAMYDPAASIGGSDRARALRIVADDLVSALRRAAPGLRRQNPDAYDQAAAHARTALGLLRYHAAMASTSPDRIAALLSLRAEMMAENLLAIVAREQRRGPTLVFAHNAHLQRAKSDMQFGGDEVSWDDAGALVELALGERYVFLATDANPRSAPGTLQGELAGATTRRALFPAQALRAALPPSTTAGEPIVPGHLPLKPEQLAGADAVIFIADTDGKQHQFW